jgi:hypothetical protein
MADGGLAEIEETVAGALLTYRFRRRERGYALFRRAKSGGRAERLVDGRWVRVRPSRPGRSRQGWETLDKEELTLHVRRYLISGLDDPPVGWRSDVRERLKRTLVWRWAMPPLKGGAGRRLARGTAERSRRAYGELLNDVKGEGLAQLKEQAVAGYEHQRQRGAETEQRANFFLGAAGLTTSLVLANAGLLIGASGLQPPWRGLAAIALGAASVCAIAAGLRAMQAMMIAFFRTPPNAVDRIFDRSTASGEEMTRLYLAALLVAQGRAGAIGDWKINRLRDARRWFVCAIVGVVLLTAFVLVEAL